MKRPSTGIIILNVFICIAIFFPILFVFFFGQVRYYISNDGIDQIIGVIMDSSDMDSSTEFVDVKDILYDLDIDEDEMSDEFIEDTENLSKEVTGEMVRYFLTGEGEMVDVDALMDYFEEYSDEIEDITGEEIDDDYLDEIRDYLEDSKEEVEKEFERTYSNSEEYRMVNKIFSANNVIIPLVIVIVGLLIIFATFNKRIDYSLKYSGVTFLVASIFMMLAQAFTLLVKYAAVDSSVGDTEGLENFFNLLIRNSLIIAGIVFVSSIVLIIIGNSIRKKFKEIYGADFEPRPATINANQYFGNNTYTNVPTTSYTVNTYKDNNGTYVANQNQYNNGAQYQANQNPYNNGAQYVGNQNPYNNGAQFTANQNTTNQNTTNQNTYTYSNMDQNTSMNNNVSSVSDSTNINTSVDSGIDTSVDSYVSTDVNDNI